MDAFALSISYGILNLSKKTIVITSLIVGLFHFFMPFLGSICGDFLFKYIIIKPKYVIFVVFLLLSIDMFLNFFETKPKLRNLNIFGIILFALSVSLDSFSVGLGLNYLYDNLLFSLACFCVISGITTLIGFIFGKYMSKSVGKYSFLIGSISLFIYSIWVLTN